MVLSLFLNFSCFWTVMSILEGVASLCETTFIVGYKMVAHFPSQNVLPILPCDFYYVYGKPNIFMFVISFKDNFKKHDGISKLVQISSYFFHAVNHLSLK